MLAVSRASPSATGSALAARLVSVGNQVGAAPIESPAAYSGDARRGRSPCWARRVGGAPPAGWLAPGRAGAVRPGALAGVDAGASNAADAFISAVVDTAAAAADAAASEVVTATAVAMAAVRKDSRSCQTGRRGIPDQKPAVVGVGLGVGVSDTASVINIIIIVRGTGGWWSVYRRMTACGRNAGALVRAQR